MHPKHLSKGDDDDDDDEQAKLLGVWVLLRNLLRNHYLGTSIP